MTEPTTRENRGQVTVVATCGEDLRGPEGSHEANHGGAQLAVFDERKRVLLKTWKMVEKTNQSVKNAQPKKSGQNGKEESWE